MSKLKIALTSVAIVVTLMTTASAAPSRAGNRGPVDAAVECPHNCAPLAQASACVGPNCAVFAEPNGGRGRSAASRQCPTGVCAPCGTQGCDSSPVGASSRCPVHPCGPALMTLANMRIDCIGPNCFAAAGPNGGRGITPAINACPNGGCVSAAASGRSVALAASSRLPYTSMRKHRETQQLRAS